MKLIDAEQLEQELTKKTSGYNERAKTILWEYVKILHRQKVKNFMSWDLWLFACGTCFAVGFLMGKCG